MKLLRVFVSLLLMVCFAVPSSWSQQLQQITSSTHLTEVRQRQTLWCWAAAMESLFKSYGYDVPQEMIVEAAFGYLVNSTASPKIMTALLNRTWTDTHGKRFRVSARVTDTYSNTADDVTVADCLNALRNGQLIFFANDHHAMVSDQANIDGYGRIWAARVMDPDFGVKVAKTLEIHALYTAIPVIEGLQPDGDLGTRQSAPEQSDQTPPDKKLAPRADGSFCTQLKRAISLSPADFKAIRGKADGEIGWDTNFTFGPFTSCKILRTTDSSLSCDTDSKDFSSIDSSMSSCLKDWEKSSWEKKNGDVSSSFRKEGSDTFIMFGDTGDGLNLTITEMPRPK